MDPQIDCRQLVDAIGDAVIVGDASGAITLWNPAAERMFGYTEAEALGQSLDMIIPERLRAAPLGRLRQDDGTPGRRVRHDVLRVPAVHKDGRALSIAFTVSMLLRRRTARSAPSSRSSATRPSASPRTARCASAWPSSRPGWQPRQQPDAERR